MAKYMLVGFTGELTCFAHILINALDMTQRGHEARIIFEGASVNLVQVLAEESCSFHGLYKKVQDAGLVEGACKACAAKLGATGVVAGQGIPFLDAALGHPSLAEYLDGGWQIITV